MAGQRALDEVGREILRILQDDGRISFNELGRKVGLSSPAVAERVRRMEDEGIICGYKAVVDHTKIGYSIMAFVRLSVAASQFSQFVEAARAVPEVLECHHLTGHDGITLKVIVPSVEYLENVIAKFGDFGVTITSIILSSPINNRPINPLKP